MSRFALFMLVATLALAPVAGAHDLSSDWTQYRGGPEKASAGANAGPTSTTVAWTHTVSVSGEQGGTSDINYPSPVIADGRVFMGYQEVSGGTSKGKLFAYDIKGTAGAANILWSKDLKNNVRGTAVINGDTVYVVGVDAPDSTVYALQASDGSQRWAALPGGRIDNSVTLYENTIYVPNSSGNVYALSADTGATQWKTNHQLGVSRGNALAASGDQLFFSVVLTYPGCDRPCTNDVTYSVRRGDGSVAWQKDPTDQVSLDDDMLTTPTVAGGLVFVASGTVAAYDDNFGHHPAIPGRFYALDASTGAVKWTKETPDHSYTDPAIADGVVYAANRDGHVYAWDAADGHQRWSVTINDAVATSVAVSDNRVYVGSTGGDGDNRKLQALSVSDGRELWSKTVEQLPVGTPAVAQGYAVFKTFDPLLGQVNLVAIGTDAGSHPANEAPAFGSTNVVPSETALALSWTVTDANGGDAHLADIYLGTSNPPPLARNLHAGTDHSATNLLPGTTYYWRVDVTDGHGGWATTGVLSASTGGNPPPPTSETTDGPTTSDEEDGGEDSDGGTPGFEVALLATAALLVLARRRR